MAKEKFRLSKKRLKKGLNELKQSKPSQNLSISETKQSSEEILQKLHKTWSFEESLAVSEVKTEESTKVNCNVPEKTEQLSTFSEKPSNVSSTRELENQRESQNLYQRVGQSE